MIASTGVICRIESPAIFSLTMLLWHAAEATKEARDYGLMYRRAYSMTLTFTGGNMRRVMTTLAVIGVLAAAYFAYKYGIF